MPPKGGIDRSKISSPTGPVQTAYNPKFQLPALSIPQAPLTEGTSIPPPKPTPPPSPPQTPLSTDSPNPLRSHPTSSLSLHQQFTADAQSRNGHASPPVSGNPRSQRGNTISSNKMPPPSSGSQNAALRPGSKRGYSSHIQASGPASPPSKRQSIRKLLSLKSLTNRSSTNVSQLPARSESPAPSTMTGMTGTTASTQHTPKKRRSGAFWRKRDSFFGLSSVGEGAEKGEDVVMGGTQNENAPLEEPPKDTTPPPTLPEMETIGEGVKMDFGSIEAEEDESKGKVSVDSVKARRRPSGFFGGAAIFEGIS